MKLYIDTSDSDKVIVGLDEERFEAASKAEKSQKLLPFLMELLEKRGQSPRDITEIEVNTGPGSFTGLRVGISVASALGWALGIPVNGKQPGQEPIEAKYS